MNKWQYFKKIQKELNFLHKQRIDTVFHITNPDPLKPGDDNMKSPESCIFCDTDFNEHGMFYGCELNNKTCRLINDDSCENYQRQCNTLKRIWLWLKRVFHVLMS